MEARQVYNRLPATIDVPPELRNRHVEVILFPLDSSSRPQLSANDLNAVDANGWPAFFLRKTFGSIPDLPEREPQGEYERREEFK